MKIECDSCGYEVDKTQIHKVIEKHAETVTTRIGWFCTICYSTMAGNAYFFPSQYENKEIMRMIAYVGNMALDAIKEKL